MALRYKNVYWLWLSAVIMLVDQLTKQFVFLRLDVQEIIHLTPFLNLTHRHNTGAAFSIMAGAHPAFFALLGVVVSCGILWWLRQNPEGQRLLAAALTLILGGALGNVIDRVWRGFVVDFVDFHAFGWHWPAFNVADTAICLGAGLMLLDMWRQPKAER